jgi:ABC-type multidrug transport system fused ATPase/permease subunit
MAELKEKKEKRDAPIEMLPADDGAGELMMMGEVSPAEAELMMAEAAAPSGSKKTEMPAKGSAKGGPSKVDETPVPYGKLFRWGWAVCQGAMFPFILSLVFGVLNIVIMQLNVQLVGAIVSRLQSAGLGPSTKKAAGGGDLLAALVPSDPWSAFGVLAVLTIVGVFVALAERGTTTWSDTSMLARLQRKLHDRLLQLGPSYHHAHASGETTSIVWRYANGAQMLLRDLIAFPVIRGIGLVTALTLLFQNISRLGDTPLAFKLVLLFGVLATPAISARGASTLRAAFARVRASDVAANEELQNSLGQPLEVQLMGAIPQRSEAFGSKAEAHAKNRRQAAMKNDIISQLRASIPRLLQLGFLGYGVYLAVKSDNPEATGAVVAVYALVPMAIQPLSELVQFFQSISMAWPEVEAVIEILEAPTDVNDAANPRALADGAQPIVFDKVEFSYLSRTKQVLKGVSHTFTTGKTIAIVGASGSGKSTIFNLTARLSDPSGGSVSIGGVNLKDTAIANLRRRVVRVAQFPLFVAASVRENFRLAKPDATDKEIEEVAKKTGLWDVLVAAAPDGPLDNMLPRDVAQGLSGGQRRLLAISRALLLKPSVLLLDEPSAGLDNITLQKLIKFLKNETAGMTVLVIDHDLEGFVAKIADEIAVLENGAIALSGSHDELMKTDNLYKRLYEAPSLEAQKEKVPA